MLVSHILIADGVLLLVYRWLLVADWSVGSRSVAIS